jgi:hypothetical protein
MKKIIPIFHSIIFLTAVGSPFWIDWKIVLIGFILYKLQFILFKGCVLSFAEFGKANGKPKERFTPYYLSKVIGRKLDEEKVGKYLDSILAPLIPILAIVFQLLLGLNPAIQIS